MPNEKCSWCGVKHPVNTNIPKQGDRVILYAPFFSHNGGDKVIKTFLKCGDIWIFRAGTSGGEETPISCIKQIIKMERR